MSRNRRGKHFEKSPIRNGAPPGTMVAPINANAGGMQTPLQGNGAPGHLPDTDLLSQYTNAKPLQPQDFIQDVDINSNWWSPFQPVTPFGPPFWQVPRTYDYQVGHNLQFIQERQEFYAALDAISHWSIIRALIERRKDRFLRQPWEIRLIDKEGQKDPRIDELKAFFRKPDGKNRFSKWVRLLLEDMLTIDAATVYLPFNRGGKPMRAEVLQGRSIFPLIDDAGRRPDFPQPAFQQLTKGLPMLNLHERELLYAPMRPRTNLPIYGYSSVEQIRDYLLLGIRRTIYQNNFYTEGTMPETIIGVPEAWTPQQIASFQGFFDALLAGNQYDKSKVRFVPGGMTPYDIKNANGEALKCDIDEWITRIACFVMGESPEPFVKQLNRAQAEQSADSAEEASLHPTNQWFIDNIANEIIQDGFGYDDMEFVIKPPHEVDPLKQAQVQKVKVDSGIWRRNEARAQDNLEPVEGGDELTVTTSKGVFRLSDSLQIGENTANTPIPDPNQPKGPSSKSEGSPA